MTNPTEVVVWIIDETEGVSIATWRDGPVPTVGEEVRVVARGDGCAHSMDVSGVVIARRWETTTTYPRPPGWSTRVACYVTVRLRGESAPE